MIKFLTIELEEEIKECLNYIKQFEKGRRGLNLDFYDILNPEFDPDDYGDIIIDENFKVTISPDESENEYTITLREAIDLMNEVKTAKLIDNEKCVSSKRGLVRVAPRLYEDIELLDTLLYNNISIFETESRIDNTKFACRIIRGFSLFGILVHFSNEFDKYNPSISSDDMFIEVIPENAIDWKNLDIIIEAYIFELFATHGIKLSINPRFDSPYDAIVDEDVFEKEYIFRPLLLGKGLSEVIKLFNSAEEGFNNLDYSIEQNRYAIVL